MSVSVLVCVNECSVTHNAYHMCVKSIKPQQRAHLGQSVQADADGHLILWAPLAQRQALQAPESIRKATIHAMQKDGKSERCLVSPVCASRFPCVVCM